MSNHLAPQRFIEAIDASDGTALAPAEQEHLRECVACRGEVDALRVLLREVEAAPAAEPSPLFWDHFGDRVRQATAAMPVRPSWWTGWLKEDWLWPVALAGASLTVVALAVLVRPGAPAPTLDAVVADASAEALPALGDESWDLVVSLAGDLTWEEAERAATPRAGVADAMIDELSAAERAELVKLLKREMGGLE